MTTLWQDVRYGCRMLAKNPGFTIVAVLALALGVGANTTIFSVVNAVLLRPLPYPNAERLVALSMRSAQDAEARTPFSYPDIIDYRNQAKTLEHVAAYNQIGTVLRNSEGEFERILGANVSAELFPMLGVKPLLGRAFTPEEDRAGAPGVIVLGYGMWQSRFGSDPQIVGREIKIGTSGRGVTVVGVMPDGFKFPAQAEQADFWLPFTREMARVDPTGLENRDSRQFPVVASLKPGATLAQADAELNTIARRLTEQYPAGTAARNVRVVWLHEEVVGNVRPALLVLLGAVGFVLLIACANVANLLLARAASRGREIAVRSALGASRARLIRQLLTESVLLSMAGGAVGLLLAVWGIEFLIAAAPSDIPRLAEVRIDARVLLFTLAAAGLTGVVFGLAPALQASKLDLNESLKEGGRGAGAGARRNRVRSLLVVAEVALSLALLIGAGLLIRSFMSLLNADPGYTKAGVLTVALPLSSAKYPQPEARSAYLQEILRSAKSLPGVDAVAATNLLPLGLRDIFGDFNVEGRPPVPAAERVAARNYVVTPDYFRAMNVPVRRGRAFTERDAKDAPPVVVINETFTRRIFPGEDPLGRRLVLKGDDGAPLPPREIVGVVGNVRFGGLDEPEQPEYYISFFQPPGQGMDLMNLVVHSTTSAPAALAPAVRNAIKEIDRDQLIWEVKTMDERVAQSVAPRRFQMWLLGAFALLALLLASIGIYGVMSYSVTQRTHELGLRVALGAQKSDVMRLVIKQGLALVLSGVGVGLVAALLLSRVLTSLLYGVSALDPVTFALTPLLLIGVALLACYIPARRAMWVDPMVALRYE